MYIDKIHIVNNKDIFGIRSLYFKCCCIWLDTVNKTKLYNSKVTINKNNANVKNLFIIAGKLTVICHF